MQAEGQVVSAEPSAQAIRGSGQRSALSVLARVGGWLLGIVLVLLFVLPYAWMLGSSLRSQEETFRYVYPFQWNTLIPASPTLAAYTDLFTRLNFGRIIVNTLLVAFSVTLLGALANSLAGFAFARMPLPGREILLLLALSTSFIPFEAIVVPTYLVVKSLGLVNTYWALILPWIINPFGILLLREAFSEVPVELSEAATVDGASWPRIWWSIMLPLVRPSLISFALVQFLWTWDSFFWPLVVTQDPQLRVMQVFLATLSTESSTRWDWIFAASSASTVPILVAFILAQRYFIRGIATTGLK